MTTNPYQVFGPSIPPMLGRAALMQSIENHLLKPDPDHVSVVGPARYGKSVLLYHLADAGHSRSGHYLTTAYIDLRHGTPESDSAFKRRFAEAIRKALQAAKAAASPKPPACWWTTCNRSATSASIARRRK